MVHTRLRHLSATLKRAAKFWPVVAILGPRQSGKSTLLRDQLSVGKFVSFDDEDTREDAESSAKVFLQKLPTPLVIDEAQKVPKIFDAIKSVVDQKKRPGTYFLTGSSQFSAKLGIRESLTGRIGIHYLYPMTLCESYSVDLEIERANTRHRLKDRFKIADLLKRFQCGGLPVPFFMRSEGQMISYFQSWIETTVLRDTQRLYGRGYNPDVAFSILNQLTAALKAGEYATLKHFKQPSTVLRRYMTAMEDVFLIRRIPPTAESVGTDLWTFFDTGFLAYFAKGVIGEGLQVSLARISVLNEIHAVCEYSEQRLRPTYYKTARGAPIDLIWDDSLIKISSSAMSQVEYDLRPLRAAMKKLSVKHGVLLWGFDKNEHEKISGVGEIRLSPWTRYS